MNIVRIFSTELLFPENWQKLVLMYRECFSEPPWRETYFYNTILTHFEKMLFISNLICLISFSEEGEIQGATFAYPVIHNREISDFLVKKEINNLSEIIYLAEIFVDKKFRNQGVGRLLHQQRLKLAKNQGIEYAVERTSPSSKMFSIILKDGFAPIGGMEVMSLKNISGTQIMVPESRVISIKKI